MTASWEKIEKIVKEASGKKPDHLNNVLILIGIQELGQGARNFSKEEKQDLLHVAICAIFSLGGFYRYTGRDEEGWPHYKLTEKVPHAKLMQQESLIKDYIIQYFEEKGLLS